MSHIVTKPIWTLRLFDTFPAIIMLDIVKFVCEHRGTDMISIVNHEAFTSLYDVVYHIKCNPNANVSNKITVS